MKYTKYILSIVIPFLIMYLITCFINLSFDVREWSLPARAFMCLLGSFLSFSTFMYIEIFKKD